MNDFITSLFYEIDALDVINDIKKVFKNKELHDILDDRVRVAIKDKKMVIDTANFYHFEIRSKEDCDSIVVEIAPCNSCIEKVTITIYYKDNSSNTENTLNYELTYDRDEEKITVEKVITEVFKRDIGKTIKINVTTNVKTFVDNNLRYELEDINTLNLEDKRLNHHNAKETYIDLDKRAVQREITFIEGTIPFSNVKYLESDYYLTKPFNDLYNVPNLKNNIMIESSEETFKDFLYGGNNYSLYK